MNFNSKNAGFTLVELLVVIAILGILAAVGIPAYNGYIEDARNKEAQSTLQSIVLMQKNYYSENFCYFLTGSGNDKGSEINKILFGASDVEKNTSPIDTSIKNFFYFEITGNSNDACLLGQSKGYDFLVKAIKRSDNTKWFSINQKLSKLDQDGKTW